jgi:hypothetical protein
MASLHENARDAGLTETLIAEFKRRSRTARKQLSRKTECLIIES